ncbi:hypothetical protein [Bremerella alba]|uniref:Uncharacterized protein n=1 Tax=Bremerella alba TaxID=980252 RepID=A0A7V8V4U0_9BACT|nr:hypothetical protein [Bremerella alba]MBA2114840.1 hypothetical protein [Bremerella alba]
MPKSPSIRSALYGLRGLILFTCLVATAGLLYAQAPEVATGGDLAERQKQLGTNFEVLEKLMLKMADIDEANNPQRATLLREAVRNSRNLRVLSRMEETTGTLNEGQLKRATDQQSLIENDLRTLLKLLQSENRDEQIKDEEARIKSYIKSAQKLLNRQRSIQGRTEGGASTKPLSDEQARLADDAKSLSDDIAEQEEGGRPTDASQEADAESQNGKSGESEDQEGKSEESKEGEPSEGQEGEDKPGDMNSSGDDPQDGQSKNGQSKEGQSKEGQSKEGESQEGQSSESEGEPKDGESSDQEKKEGDSEKEDSEKEDSEMKDGKSEKSDGQKGESPMEGQSQENQEGKSGEKSQQGQQGQPSQQQGQQGQPGEQSQQDQQQQQEFSPRKRIEEAQRRMQEAQKKLDDADKEGAVQEQQAARDELAQAIAELEEILRQLREEEIERVLARLEARFMKLLEMQLRVNDDTERLSQIPLDQRGSAEDAEAGKLSFSEKQIMVEADKCLELLKEEGSSIAFPESMMMVREDMQEVANRLGQAKLDSLTITIEEDIVTGLEELLEALKQAQKDQEERKQQQQQQQQQQQGEEPLVDKIAELRLIKSMQVRVNQRTNRYAQMLDDADDEVGQATSDDLKNLLRDLAERQSRIYDITRDNVQGKNQ